MTYTFKTFYYLNYLLTFLCTKNCSYFGISDFMPTKFSILLFIKKPYPLFLFFQSDPGEGEGMPPDMRPSGLLDNPGEFHGGPDDFHDGPGNFGRGPLRDGPPDFNAG